MILSIKGLKAGYGNRPVLKGINMEVHEGEKIVIMGPNGSGKTTLVRVLLKLIPYEGSVNVMGNELKSLRYFDLKHYFSFQLQNQIVSDIRVITYLKLADVVLKEDPFEVESLMERKMNTLSSGEMQRVKLTKAFLSKGKIIVLDEPFSHLDPYFQMKLVKLINSEIRTVILISHDVMFCIMFFKKHLLMKDGMIVSDSLSKDAFRKVFGISMEKFTHPRTT